MLALIAALSTVLAIGPAPAPPDHTAPTRPGPLVADISTAGVILRWAPSSDDRGPVRYEIYDNGRLRATVTTTEFQYAQGPPPPAIFILSVRAVDAAGNVSPSAYTTLGRIWRGDEIPPPPTDVTVTRAGRTLLRISWTPPAMPSPFQTPPAAGYEVLVDGTPATAVGTTVAYIPRPAPGPHVYGVRTINAVDQLSTPAETTHR